MAFICVMAGFEAYPQSQGSAVDSGALIRENTKNAVFMMRKLCSAEMAFQEGSEDSEFGTAIELYSYSLIDTELAAALGCSQITSAKGKTCEGTHTPYLGYLYRLDVLSSAPSEIAKFKIVGVPAIAKGEMKSGTCTYYVDQTYVIRASDDPEIEANDQSPPLGTPWAPASCEWRNNM